MISTSIYTALKAWEIEANSKSPAIKVRRYGLCNWLANFSGKNSCRDLQEIFAREFSNTSSPFGGPWRYYRDCANLTQHKNELRRAWVRSKIEEYEAAHK